MPVVVLGVLGGLFLRQDRRLADKEARERAQSSAEELARHCLAALTDFSRLEPTAAYTLERLRAGENRCVAFLDAEGRLAFPRPYAAAPAPPVLDLSALTPPQARLWEAARTSAFAQGDSGGGIDAWERFLRASPPPPFAAIGQFSLAMACERQGRPEAPAAFERVSAIGLDAVGESGLPLQPLAAWRWLSLSKPSPATNGTPEPGIWRSRLDRFCTDLIAHPSPATATLLDLAAESFAGLAASPGSKAWREVWWNHELTRALFRQAEAARPPPARESAPTKPALFWTTLDSPWLGVQFVTNPSCIVWQTWDEANRKVSAEIGRARAIPEFCAVAVTVSGTNLGTGALARANDRDCPVLATASAPDPAGPLKVTLRLTDPDRLYARQRARTLWFIALIAVAGVGALVGLVATGRALQRQQRLLELKSNFVSSVTHELRAPLASVRLLAESLERGKITLPEKRQEYFHFIVQECRRLSSLIENVLDFARIEQGRKQYRLEPVDLADLARQTVQVLEPYAAERQVRLEWRGESAKAAEFALRCDGQAIQQALINLIDNAVKHSPPEASVTIGLDASDRTHQLWVEDHGPGIPPEDCGKIFEQFYRRGSELRRESAGIGIGLTLVKHIAEAHRGRVQVRSEVGKGSRFTLVLPMDT